MKSPSLPAPIEEKTLISQANHYFKQKNGLKALKLYLESLSSQELSEKEKVHVFYQIARIYRKGLGDEQQSLEKAAEFFQKASNLGHSRSMFELSLLKMSGKGMVQDIFEGRALLKQAVLLGNKKAKALWEDVQNSIQYLKEPQEATQALEKNRKKLNKMKLKKSQATHQHHHKQVIQNNQVQTQASPKIKKSSTKTKKEPFIKTESEHSDASFDDTDIQDNHSISISDLPMTIIEEPLHVGILENDLEILNQSHLEDNQVEETHFQESYISKKAKRLNIVDETPPQQITKSEKNTPKVSPILRPSTTPKFRPKTPSSPLLPKGSPKSIVTDISRTTISPLRNSTYYQQVATIDSLKLEIDELRSQITRNSQLARQEILDVRNNGIKQVKKLQNKLGEVQLDRDQLMIRVDDLISELQLLKQENNALKLKIVGYESDREVHSAERISLIQSITRLNNENVRLNALVDSIRNSKYNHFIKQIRNDKLGKMYNVPQIEKDIIIRSDLIKQIHIQLMERNLVILHGEEFSGKTQLCLSLAYRESTQSMFQDGIVYIPKDASFSKIYRSIIPVFGTDKNVSQNLHNLSKENTIVDFISNYPELSILFILDDITTMDQMKTIIEATSIASNSRFLVVSNIATSSDYFSSNIYLSNSMDQIFIEKLATQALKIAPPESFALDDKDLASLVNVIPSGFIDTLISTSKTTLLDLRLLFSYLSLFPPSLWTIRFTDALVLSNHSEKSFALVVLELFLDHDTASQFKLFFPSLSIYQSITSKIPIQLLKGASPLAENETNTILYNLEKYGLAQIFEEYIYIPRKIIQLISNWKKTLELENPESINDNELHSKIVSILKSFLHTKEWTSFFHPNLYFTEYYFQYLTTHIYKSGDLETLREVLLHGDWYLQKLNRFENLQSILQDLSLDNNPVLEFIKGAITLATPQISESPNHLPHILIPLISQSVEVYSSISLLIHDLKLIAGTLDNEYETKFFLPYQGMLMSVFRAHKQVKYITFVQGSNSKVLSCDEHKTYLWNIKTGKLINVFPCGGHIVASSTMNKINVVIIASKDGTIQVYPLYKLGESLQSLKFEANYLVPFDDKSGDVLLVTKENLIYIWNLSHEAPEQIFEVNETIKDVLSSPGWIFIFTNKEIINFNQLTRQFNRFEMLPVSNPKHRILTTAQRHVNILGVDPLGMHAIVTDPQTHLITTQNLFYPDSQVIPQFRMDKYESNESATSSITTENQSKELKNKPSAWILPSNAVLVAQSKRVSFVKIPNGDELCTMHLHGFSKRAILSEDYRYLLTLMNNGEIRVWDITRTKELLTLDQK